MIVFDLRCAGGHVFEAMFGSSAAFEDQRAGGLIRCPLCDDADVRKAAMAPAVAAKSNRGRADAPAAVKDAMRRIAADQARALQGSRWVGSRFADEARAMHLGETPASTIHGRATLAEAQALVEEGVPVAPLPLPVVPPRALN